MSVYGYARVSTLAQKTDRQIDALRGGGATTIFVDKTSGKDFIREKYREMIGILNSGDVLIIKSIDRLGRNYSEILEQWRLLTKEKKVDVVVLDMPLLDTRKEKNLLGTFISDLVLQVLSFVAENERTYILERQREGIAAAKRRGVKFGRPRVKNPPDFREIVLDFAMGYTTLKSAVRASGLSATTFRRHAREILETLAIAPNIEGY